MMLEVFFDVFVVIIICTLKDSDGNRGLFDGEDLLATDLLALVWWAFLAVIFILFSIFLVYVSLNVYRKYASLR